MTRLYFEPIQVDFEDGAPREFIWRRKAHRVTVVLRRWMVRVDWWREEVAREYYKVECENLGTYEIYCSAGFRPASPANRTAESHPASLADRTAGSHRAPPADRSAGLHPAPPPDTMNPAAQKQDRWFLERVYD